MPFPVLLFFSEWITRYLHPAVIILEALDIAFVEVISGLDLDDHQFRLARVLDAMKRAAGDIDGLPFQQNDLVCVQRQHGLPGYDQPVLVAVSVSLETEALFGIDDDALDLVLRILQDDIEIPPGSL